jgi:hypothetical protein
MTNLTNEFQPLESSRQAVLSRALSAASLKRRYAFADMDE